MDFHFTELQEQLRQGARELGKRFGVDYWRKKDKEKAFISEMWAELGKGGWLGLIIPEKYGGAGLGMLEMAIVIEELAASGAGSTIAQGFMISPIFGALTILHHGSEEQKQYYLPRLARGESIVALGLTEPDAGSNAFSIRTTAEPDGDEYVINGRKVFITGLDVAEEMILVARTPTKEGQSRTEVLSLFIVDPRTPGITMHPIEKVGTNCFASFSVYLDDVRIPRHRLLGREGQGWRQLLSTLNTERIAAAAGAVGAGLLAIDIAVQYAKQRTIFKDPIAAYQGIQFPLARLRAELETARLLNYKAAWLFDRGEPCGAEANMAKLLAADAASRAVDQAIQTLGGYGFASEFHLERLWRDMRLWKLAPISQEMCLNYIAQHVLEMPRSY